MASSKTPVLLTQYRENVNELMLSRLRIMCPVAVFLHQIFSFLDYLVYPNYAELFFNIRILNNVLIGFIFVLSFIEKIKKNIELWGHLMLLIPAAGSCWMIMLTDGTMSSYYEGLNLALIALIVFNGYYPKHNFATGALMLAMYTLATFLNDTPWVPSRYFYALYFMGATLALVVLMTKFYSSQHLDGFIKNQKLIRSEKELAEKNEELSLRFTRADMMSKMDELTKIYNRRHFFEILDQKIKHCYTHNSFFYLVIFDIDHFKTINDTCGHAFGDEVIEKVAQTVHGEVRANSYIGRYGGDEFMIIFDKATKEELFNRLTHIGNKIKSMILVHDHKEVQISASFGAAKFDPNKKMDEASLIKLADTALLNVKRRERGTVEVLQ